jgi:hypothetical protein
LTNSSKRYSFSLNYKECTGLETLRRQLLGKMRKIRIDPHVIISDEESAEKYAIPPASGNANFLIHISST